MSHNPDFLLVFDTHISVYKDILSGIPIRIVTQIAPHTLSPLHPGDSKRRPHWVAWDKTPRNLGSSKEAFYIAREDGRIIYAERGPAIPLDVNEAGVWPYCIETAFACLSVGNSEPSPLYPDVLIAGGAGNDGILCKVGSYSTEFSYTSQDPGTNQITYIESMPNWTPMTDLVVTRFSGSRGAKEHGRAGIFVTNGQSPYGQVSELRYGLQASVDDSFSGLNGCTGLWVIDYGSQAVEIDGTHEKQHYVTFAITLAPETLVIRIFRAQHENHQFSGTWDYQTWNKYQVPSEDEPIVDGIMRDEETISACCWSDLYSVQITRQEARILHRPTLRQHDSILFEDSLLLAASIPGAPFVAITYRESGMTYLEIMQLSSSITFERNRNDRVCLAYDPTCVDILDIDSVPHIFVSTFDSKAMLFEVSCPGGLSPVSETTLDGVVPDATRLLCESAVVLGSAAQRILVCATRNGYLLSSVLTVDRAGNTNIDDLTRLS